MDSLIYQFEVTTLGGENIFLEKYRGKTLLVVNTASKCGLTPQYEGLQNLYRKYYEQDFVILGFPCDQFANQEPNDEHSIASACLVNYGVSFPMFSKIKVNGRNAHPLFKHLKEHSGGIFTKSIKWNFTKFLVNANGIPVKRFSPFTSPDKIENFMKKEFYFI